MARLSAVAGARPGRLVLDTLGARTTPTAAIAEPALRDPIVAGEAEVRARPWRFALAPAAPTGGSAQDADLVLTGAPRPPFVHRGVRFLTLDTSRRTLDGGGLARLRALRAELAAAAREPDTGALAVVQRYATPGVVDRKEAALLARLLAEFRRTAGKRAVLLTVGAPGFTAGRSEGVLSVSAPPTGTTLVGADAFAAGDWLSVREKSG